MPRIEHLYALLVGGSGLRNVYPLRLPDEADLPAIVYEHIPLPRTLSLQGDDVEQTCTWHITAWAETYRDANEAAQAVVSALSQWEAIVSVKADSTVTRLGDRAEHSHAKGQLCGVPIEAEAMVEVS